MVDVSAKAVTAREAVARGEVTMRPATLALVAAGTMPKGDVLARTAGTGTSGRPISCRSATPAALDVDLDPEPDGPAVRIRARVRVTARTGVEMEALTAVAVAALTLYDMCKAVDRGMTIEDVRLVEKRGGRSGAWMRPRA
jgi:cyclic pyranopterin phosphate synthase